MKQVLVFVLVICVIVQACVVTKSKMPYDFPEAMSEPVRAAFTEQCARGKVLYDLNCAKCHNSKYRGRTIIPDFTSAQLIGYELRVQNPRHESNIPETRVNAEELGLIITFLTYKKKNK